MSDKKQLAVNMVTNLLYMAINYVITFFLTSYIVSNISGEAYGFIGLCNNLINYATLVTVALNSVAGRFITIEVHRGNCKKANQYFSSTLAANFVLSVAILIIVIPIAINIDYVFNVPTELIGDVRNLFILTAVNLIISVLSTVFTVSTFITNKLYLSSIANLCGILVRAALLLVMLSTLTPSIVYVGLATVSSTLLIWIINVIYTKKLCPELGLKRQDISVSVTKELFSSGIWSTVTKLSQILSDGMDLLFSNLWIGAYTMGQLSVAYTLPTFVAQFLSMIINLFSPKLTENYAKDNKNKIIEDLQLNMKLTGFFGNVIFFGVVFMGKEFFELWVPTADINLVYPLAIIACGSVLVSSVCSPLSNVFLMANKLKVNSLVWLGAGVFDAITVVLLIKGTGLGVFAVAGVSKAVAIVIYLTFWPMYTSKCLEDNSSAFYKIIGKYFIVCIFMGAAMGVVKLILWNCTGWMAFFIQVIILAVVGMSVNYIFFLNKEERKYISNIVIRKVFKR